MPVGQNMNEKKVTFYYLPWKIKRNELLQRNF